MSWDENKVEIYKESRNDKKETEKEEKAKKKGEVMMHI